MVYDGVHNPAVRLSDTGADSYCCADTYSCTCGFAYSRADADAHSDANDYTHANTRGYCDTDAKSDCYADTHAHADADAYTYADSNSNSCIQADAGVGMHGHCFGGLPPIPSPARFHLLDQKHFYIVCRLIFAVPTSR
jgi:hypothetical protein